LECRGRNALLRNKIGSTKNGEQQVFYDASVKKNNEGCKEREAAKTKRM
jgi:hypothetical protein